MGRMMRFSAAAGLALALAMPLPVTAQGNDETVTRPNFLAAMGLLRSAPFEASEEALGKPIKLPFEISIPETDDVSAVTSTDVEGALFALEFRLVDGAFVESIIFSEAQVDLGPTDQRVFAMANLLVVSSFPSLREAYPDARILGFGPVENASAPAVQMVGTFTAPTGEPIVFRHVGLMPEGREDVLIALANIAPTRIPIRGDESLIDTYSGWVLENVSFLDNGD